MTDEHYINIDPPAEDEPKRMNIGSRTNSPDRSIVAERGASVSRTDIEISERTLSVVALTLAVAAFVIAFITMQHASESKQDLQREVDRLVREARQVQIQVMDQNALLIREGLKQPTDTTYGPAGNLEYKPKGK